VKTILLVDDEYAVVEVLAMLLGDEGYAVLTAPDGEQALEMLKEKVPDAVITDQMMPLLSGADLFLAMQRNPAHRNIPVLLMSSAPLLAAHAKLPWAKFLQKPFDFRELKEWLQKNFAATK
jgi:CheY-like chemotaxis protein